MLEGSSLRMAVWVSCWYIITVKKKIKKIVDRDFVT